MASEATSKGDSTWTNGFRILKLGGLVVIMALVASWLLYRYFAPKTWREWASAGIVQAFIIALYAEMYGFPLSIYLAVL